MIVERSFNTGIVKLNYAEGPPAGPPLVLLHGVPGRWQEFLPLVPNLILQWHVFAIDFRGQGKSGRVPGGYLSKYYVEDVKEFLQQQFDEPTILFGLSAGGMVALGVAAQVPELVRGIIVGDSPIDMNQLVSWMTSERFKYFFNTLKSIAVSSQSLAEIEKELASIPIQINGQAKPIRYADSPGIDFLHIQQLAITLSQMDPRVLEYHAEGRASAFLEGFDLDEILKKIPCPVLLLQGNPASGGMMTDEAVLHVRSIVQNVMHVLIKTAGHDLGLANWEVAPLMRAVTSFLATL
ncbi:hypothetical protein AMJ86_07005 [bacterium SM23_57]|jgi:pimeloyl-ACP methyl ester carboxylesterase|nr:MAG: hypothetical protein AMJ86_07005 [bacterium SM23_57]